MKIKLVALLSLSCLLFSCGFHLRGQGPYTNDTDLENSRVYLAATNSDGLLYRQIKRDLQFAEVQVMEQPIDADWHIIILSAETERKSVGIDQSGRTNEYQININIEYIIDSAKNIKQPKHSTSGAGDQQVNSRFLSSRRNFYFDNNDPIGKRNEEKTLLGAMRKDLSRQLLHIFASSISNQ